MYLLDTDTISLHLRGHPQIAMRIQATPQGQRFISVVSFQEWARGRLATLQRIQSRPHDLFAAYDVILSELPYFCHFRSENRMLTFDDSAEVHFARLRRQSIRSGTNDLRIASIALANNLAVVTVNVRDFSRVPDLRIEDWSLDQEQM